MERNPTSPTIAGPVSHEEAIGLIQPYLKARGNGAAAPAFLPSVGNGLKPNVLLKSKKTEQAHVVLGVHAPSYMDKDRHVIDILNGLLGEGMSSRLFLEVREQLRNQLGRDVMLEHPPGLRLARCELEMVASAVAD